MAKTAQINIKINNRDGKRATDELGESIGVANEQTRNLKQELREMKDELAGLDVGTQEFTELAQRAAELEDRIGKANSAVRVLADDFANLRGGIEIVGGISDVFGAATSAVALFGVQNESLMRMLVRLQAIQNLGNIAMRISNMLRKESAAMLLLQKIRTQGFATALGMQTAATGTATVATRALGMAMNALPIFGITAGIVALVGLFMDWGEKVDDVANKVDNLSSKQLMEMERTKQERDSNLRAFERQMKFYRLQLAKNEITEEEYNEKVKSLMDERIQKIKEIHDIEGETDEETLKNTETLINFFEEKNKRIKQHNSLISETLEKTKKLEKTVDFLKGQAVGIFLELFGDNTISKMEQQIKEYYEILKDENAKFRQEFLGFIEEDGKIMESETHKLLGDFFTLEHVEGTDLLLFALKDGAKDDINELRKFTEDFYNYLIGAAIDLAEEEKKQEKEKEKLREEAFKKEQERQELMFLIVQQSMQNSLNDLKRNLQQKEQLEQFYGQNTLEERLQILEQEKNIIDDRYDYEVSKADGNANKIALIELKRTEELEALKARELEVINRTEEAKRELVLRARIAQNEAVEAELQAQMATELAVAKSEQEKENIRNHYAEKLKNIQIQSIKDNAAILIENTKLTENERIKIIAEAERKIAEIRTEGNEEIKKSTQELMMEIQQIANEALFALADTIGTINMYFDEQVARRMYAMQLAFDAEEEGFKTMLANKTISQEEYDQNIAELEERKRIQELNERRKAFKRDKANNISSATMSAAQAVLAALTLPPPASYIMAAISGALAATQIGIISSQQFRASRGGRVPGGKNSMVDSVDAKLAPGETVINARSSEMFPGLLSDINRAGGGVRLAPDIPVSTSSSKSVYKDNEKQLNVTAKVVEADYEDVRKRNERFRNNTSF